MIVSWNGQLVSGGVVPLPVDDALFLRGQGVFETIRAEEGCPLLWERHYGRLRTSATVLGWTVPDAGTLLDRVLAVLQANRLEQSRVRITVGREILVTAAPLPERSPWAQVTTSRIPVNEQSPLARIKCTSYAENIMLLEQAGGDEVIRPNLQGELCEGCISNVFFVKERRIHTPALDCGCLPGVMRAELMSRMPVVEGRWPLEVLQEADEIWLTNALSRVRAVEEIDGRSLGRDGPLFREVREMLESGSANS